MKNNSLTNKLMTPYREQKLAHAYLIETNNEEQAIKDIKNFIKLINCPNKYQENCSACNLCHLIDINNLPSLIIIEPEGASIKKAQIEELQIKFSTIPVYSKYNVYIIKNASKLNTSSANSMLKFLEEPEAGILGFFITNNKDVMLDTIKSRCQSLLIKYDEIDIIDKLNLTPETYDHIITKLKKYLTKIHQKEFINHKEELLIEFPERSDIEKLLTIIFEIYNQNLLRELHKDYHHNITEIYETKDNIPNLIKKINIITEIIQNMSYNVNMEQALDKFVIEMRNIHD